MLLRSATGLYFFGVPATGDESIAVTGEDRPVVTATAAPGEADSPQLLAAEQVGLFPYSYAADVHAMKVHAA